MGKITTIWKIFLRSWYYHGGFINRLFPMIVSVHTTHPDKAAGTTVARKPPWT